MDACSKFSADRVCAQTELSKSGPMGLLKAVLLASQGVEPVEANAEFIAEVDAAAGVFLDAIRWKLLL